MTEVPISFPIPKVIAAANKPNSTCRKPENQILLPVNNVMAEPIKNSPIVLNPILQYIAVAPLVIKNGPTGIQAKSTTDGQHF